MTNLQKVKEFAEKYFKDNKDSVHDMDHVLRVYNMVLKLAKNEKVDLEVLKISVLFHDIGKIKEAKDKTGKIDHAIESAKLAKPFLITLGLKESKIQHILDCIISHRHRNNIEPKTLEAKILYDADKIDSIGAVGIAKAFA
ncbi:MAG: HD domain-containing protein [Candidatus Paceibacterota bacterium]|nr:HD domain-containing protein [Candidatus Paceibacterota bacterium]